MSAVGYGTPFRSSALSAERFAKVSWICLPSSLMSCCWIFVITSFAPLNAEAEGMLRMVVRGDDEDVGVLAHLLHLADNRLATARSHAGIDDQRRLAADDDADVRDATDVEVGNGPDVIGELTVAPRGPSVPLVPPPVVVAP